MRILLLLLATPLLSGADEAAAQTDSGADLVREKGRFDIRTEFSEEEDTDVVKFTFRIDQPYRIDDRWSVNLRADLPLVDEEDEAIDLRDILLQAIMVRHGEEEEAAGFGLQFIIPASPDREWRVLPTLGYRWPVEGLPAESFFQTVLRYNLGLGGNGEEENKSELQFAPTLELGLGDGLYVSTFPSTDIRYDFNTDSFFLPLNAEIGKEFGGFVASLEGAVALIEGDAAPYEWKIEGRIGFRF